LELLVCSVRVYFLHICAKMQISQWEWIQDLQKLWKSTEMSESMRKIDAVNQPALNCYLFVFQESQRVKLLHRDIVILPLHYRLIWYWWLCHWTVKMLTLSIAKQQKVLAGLKFSSQDCLRSLLVLLMWSPILKDLMVSRNI